MKNVFVILGDYERFSYLVEELKRKYNIDEFDVKIYDAERNSIQEILSGLTFQPVFSEKILFIVKNVEEITKSDCEKFHKFLQKIPSNVLVVLYGISINPPFEESSQKIEEFLSPENRFFKKIYSTKNKDEKEIFEILKEYMKVREKNFTVLISGIEIFLRNILLKEKNLSEEIVKKFEHLLNLDYFLKTGRVEVGSELELYLLYYFFSDSS
ncbi:MAG: hypothetical protein NC926_05340 [Candidatus Omnitrophica bacterium]|nr:hypothetical protein [Candidatus Omnitrophota bacterium]MCM8807360.1 hypothetical protein [Candidatus Omnitrophota bacterium]